MIQSLKRVKNDRSNTYRISIIITVGRFDLEQLSTN